MRQQSKDVMRVQPVPDDKVMPFASFSDVLCANCLCRRLIFRTCTADISNRQVHKTTKKKVHKSLGAFVLSNTH